MNDIYNSNEWRYVMSINPFTKPEEIESIEHINQWDVLITYTNGKKILFDEYTGCHKVVFYDDINELTEEQERREFSYRLRSLMGRRGITQEELADMIGVTQTMISRYITGRAAPSIFVLRRIAKTLGYSMDDFFYREY